MEERSLAQRRSDEAAAAIRASESRLTRETERAEALERERRNLEAALSQRVAGLSALETKLARARSEHEDAKAVEPDPPYRAAATSSSTHLRFVVRAGGYTVSECDGELPRVGQVIEVDGERFVVSKTGPSPLPSDPRSCAYLLVELGPGMSG